MLVYSCSDNKDQKKIACNHNFVYKYEASIWDLDENQAYSNVDTWAWNGR